MDLTGEVINNTYIIRSLITETSFMQRWEAKAIFSPNSFYFDIVKGKRNSKNILKHSDILSQKLIKLQSIRNSHILKMVEFGESKGLFYSVQQKVTGPNIHNIYKDGVFYDKDLILKVMDNLALALWDFEKKGLSHNLLTPHSLWIPNKNDKYGAMYLGDSFLAYELLYADRDISYHFKRADPHIFYQRLKDNPNPLSINNDLYSYGTIFYKLMERHDIFISEDYDNQIKRQKNVLEKCNQISDKIIRDFVLSILDPQGSIKTFEQLYEEFSTLFHIKQIHKSNESSKERETIKQPLNSILNMHKEKSELDEIDDLEILEDVPEPIIKKDGAVNKMIKTVFGFLDRFRSRVKRSKNKSLHKNQSKNSYNTKSDSKNELGEATPSGDLRNSIDVVDENKTTRILKDLALHFLNTNKKLQTNKSVDLKRYKRERKEFSYNEFPLKIGAIKIEGRSKNPKRNAQLERNINSRSNNPLLSYLLKESNFINREYIEQVPKEQITEINSKKNAEASKILIKEPSDSLHIIVENKESQKLPQLDKKEQHVDSVIPNNIQAKISNNIEASKSTIKRSFWRKFWDLVKKIFNK